MISFGGVTYYEMADAIYPDNLTNLPFAPDAYLGYVDGRWPDYQAIAAAHPGTPVYGLTVFGDITKGDGTDSEPGNTTVAETPRITAGELARGVVRPVVYCPASWATQMVNAHTTAGIPRNLYRLLTAHYQGPTAAGAPIAGMHICGPATCGYGPGSDGTQWQDAGPYDRSILGPSFLHTAGQASTIPSHPGPTITVQKETAPMFVGHDDTHQYLIFAVGKIPVASPADGSALTNPAPGGAGLPYVALTTAQLAAIPNV